MDMEGQIDLLASTCSLTDQRTSHPLPFTDVYFPSSVRAKRRRVTLPFSYAHNKRNSSLFCDDGDDDDVWGLGSEFAMAGGTETL